MSATTWSSRRALSILQQFASELIPEILTSLLSDRYPMYPVRAQTAVIAAILSWTAAAHAEAPAPTHHGPHGPPPFSVYDTNHDGYLSRAEYQVFMDRMRAHRAARGKGLHRPPELLSFDAIDTNHDGRISEAEMVTALSHRMKGWRHRVRHGQMRRG
jgi:hypothetical protein